jgi:hypothetical protein
VNKYADLYNNAPDCPKCSKKMTYVYGGDRTEIGPLCLDCRCNTSGTDLSEYWALRKEPGDPPDHPIMLVVNEVPGISTIDTEYW